MFDIYRLNFTFSIVFVIKEADLQNRTVRYQGTQDKIFSLPIYRKISQGKKAPHANTPIADYFLHYKPVTKLLQAGSGDISYFIPLKGYLSSVPFCAADATYTVNAKVAILKERKIISLSKYMYSIIP